MNFTKNFFILIYDVIKWGSVFHCTLGHITDVVLCSGPSMEPTIVSNDIVIASPFLMKYKKIQHGDVIIARSPNCPRLLICKRVIGLPGDKVKCGIFCNKIVPEGHVWIQGDNTSNSTDSRDYGPIPQGLIESYWSTCDLCYDS